VDILGRLAQEHGLLANRRLALRDTDLPEAARHGFWELED